MPEPSPSYAPPAATDRPVVALYDGTPGARATVARAVTYGAHTAVVAPEGSAERLGSLADRVDEWLPTRTPDLQAALDAALATNAPWVCVPSTLMPSEDLVAEGLRQAAGFIEPDRPGFVLHVVRPAEPGGDLHPYRRVAAVSDLAESSGIAAYAAASVAARAHAELDVVLLGCDRPVTTADELAKAMQLRRDPDRFDLARTVVREAHVPVHYHSVDSAAGDEVAMALLAVERLRPDLLVAELGGQRLLRMGPLGEPDISRALASARGRMVNNLLAWLAVDVAIVLDAVSIEECTEDRRLVADAIDRVLVLPEPVGVGAAR